MEQKDLKELLLSLAAEASSKYDEALFERNEKFDEITLLVKKMEELKRENNTSVFSPRNSLSSYGAINTLEKEAERERGKLAELDARCDALLNRKEELIEGVELLDSILEDQRELVQKKEEEKIVEKEEEPVEVKEEIETPKETVAVSSDGPDVERVLETLSFLAHQCGEIAEYTIRDPYRARNELRAIKIKFEN